MNYYELYIALANSAAANNHNALQRMADSLAALVNATESRRPVSSLHSPGRMADAGNIEEKLEKISRRLDDLQEEIKTIQASAPVALEKQPFFDGQNEQVFINKVADAVNNKVLGGIDLTSLKDQINPNKEDIEKNSKFIDSLWGSFNRIETFLGLGSDSKPESTLKKLIEDNREALRSSLQNTIAINKPDISGLLTKAQLDTALTGKLAALDSIKELKEPIDNIKNQVAHLPDELAGLAKASDLDQYKKDIENRFGNLEKLIDGTKGELKTSIEGMQASINSLSGGLAKIISEDGPLSLLPGIDSRLTRLEKALGNIEKGIGSAATGAQINELRGDAGILKESLESIARELDSFNSKNEKLQEACKKLEDENTILGNKAGVFEGEKNALTAARDDFKKKFEEEKSRNEALNSDKIKLEGELKANREKLAQLEGSSATAQNSLDRLQIWDNAASIYDNARKKLAACDLFREVALKYGMDPESEAGLINTMKRMGWRDILDDMFSAAREEKEKSKQPMTETERQAYAAVNECYKDAWNVAFDVFQLPGGQNMLDEFKKCEFDKREVADLAFPRDKFEFVADVYVPTLKTDKGLVAKPGVVKGTH